MSGIALKASRGEQSPRGSVTSMLERLAHRGPNGREVLEVRSNAWRGCLGHAAHWVTPEDVGTLQPLENPEGDAVVFDGRLDNRAELCAALGMASDAPDARLVLEGFARWGEACPARFLGDFAFVIWQASTGSIFAARDRLGLINLYYYSDASQLLLSSEQQALFGNGVRARPNFESLSSALVEEFCERGSTLYQNVWSLEPGHQLTWRDGKLSTRPYWTLDLEGPLLSGTAQDHAEHFRGVLRDAVKARMRCRGRVAIAVSGGLDSSSIAALAVSIAREGEAAMPLLTTTHYPGLACDEEPFSSRLARHLGQPIHAIDAPLAGYDPPRDRELFYDPGFYLWRKMLDACRDDGVSVLMTGMGSDEIAWTTGLEVDDALVDGELRLAARLAGLWDAPTSFGAWRRLAGAMKRRARGPRRAEPSVAEWLTPLAAESVRTARVERRRRTDVLSDLHPARKLVATELLFGSQSPFGIGCYVQTGPHLGVETRHPFFDSKVVEAVFATPLASRCSFDWTKHLVREAMAPLLPASLAWRTQGAEFTTFFMGAFFSGEPLARQLFASSRLEALGLAREGGLTKLLEDCRENPRRLRELIAAFSYEVWLRRAEAFSSSPSGP